MKQANRAPMFAVLYHGLAEVARSHGYALAIHGSVVTDLDLVAVPWTEDAISAETLKDVLMAHIGACGYGDMLRQSGHSEEFVRQILSNQEEVKRHDGAEEKPHGRIAWNLWMGAGAKVDLSVMPRIQRVP